MRSGPLETIRADADDVMWPVRAEAPRQSDWKRGSIDDLDSISFVYREEIELSEERCTYSSRIVSLRHGAREERE